MTTNDKPVCYQYQPRGANDWFSFNTAKERDEQMALVAGAYNGELVARVYARPAVPDELIEEAAKAIFDVAAYPECRWETSDSGVHDYYRNMARAAARVFNGGKDE